MVVGRGDREGRIQTSGRGGGANRQILPTPTTNTAAGRSTNTNCSPGKIHNFLVQEAATVLLAKLLADGIAAARTAAPYGGQKLAFYI